MLQMSSDAPEADDPQEEVSADTPMNPQQDPGEPGSTAPHALNPRQPHNVKGPAQGGSKRKKFLNKFSAPNVKMPNVKMPNVSSPFKKIHIGRKQQTQEKQVTSSVRKNTTYVDLENRDPYNLNSHVKTSFDEVIGEPEGGHSDPRVWRTVNKSFHAGRNCCFKVLTYLCAIPLVFCWGCNFACITFAHIYSITPCFRVFFINCDCASKFFSTIVHCACDPMYEAIALTFTKIYVNFNSNSSGFQDKTYAGINMFAREDLNPLVKQSKGRGGGSYSAEEVEVMMEEKIGSIHSIHDSDPRPTYVNAEPEGIIVEDDRPSGHKYQNV